mgnify:CR=1 FL=1|jgi:hypothetical protein|tara:strand:+ start:18864 stop:19307 length:444 start_codon:yes stop_codon:yes gene_type:complete
MKKLSLKQNGIIKTAGAEDSGLTDPRTGLPIYVTTTVRKKYRQYFSEEKAFSMNRDVYSDLRNSQLNQIIAQDFAASADNVRHHFLAKSSDVASRKRNWIEIRKVYSRRAFHFFLSVISSGQITIIGTTTRYIQPTKPRMINPKAFR